MHNEKLKLINLLKLSIELSQTNKQHSIIFLTQTYLGYNEVLFNRVFISVKMTEE